MYFETRLPNERGRKFTPEERFQSSSVRRKTRNPEDTNREYTQTLLLTLVKICVLTCMVFIWLLGTANYLRRQSAMTEIHPEVTTKLCMYSINHHACSRLHDCPLSAGND